MRPRRFLVLRGEAQATAAQAEALVCELDPEAVLWIGSGRSDGHGPSALRKKLGRSYDAVVLDLHGGLDADALAQAQGFVWGGGALVLRLPKDDAPPAAMQARLAVVPYGADAVGARLWRRLLRAAEAAPAATVLAAGDRPRGGSAEQASLIETLVARWGGDAPSVTVITADRGRGKSSALGLASARLSRDGAAPVVVTAPAEDAAHELMAFADGAARFVPPDQLLADDASPIDVLIVDEAAQLSVPLLRELVACGRAQHLVFATTVHGYEGTGRGFALRFVDGLRARRPAPLELTLTTPIRWGDHDPLEATVFELLALDAEPAALAPSPSPPRLEHVVVDKEALAGDERLLRELFGLLVQAHYRTTPADLHRLLDAPNLGVEVLLEDGAVVAATLLAEEGGLSPSVSAALATGDYRIRGHALADMIVTHGGRPEAGPLPMLRSVRIATHPARRRAGLASRLVDAVHEGHAGVALFGTLFGATAELLRFRRAVGYELVRIGAARGARTGEPAAVMVRPTTEDARALVRAMRQDLARDLPLQLALHRAEPGGRLSAALEASLLAGLPDATPLTAEQLLDEVRRTVHGPRPLEAGAWAMTTFLRQEEDALRALEGDDAGGALLVLERFLHQRSWRAIASDAGLSVPAAMRAARRALGQWVPAEGDR
jgi:tRNA(Met) cytidine acetyltransferase